MIVKASAFAHLLRLAPGRSLLIHALTQTRLAIGDDPRQLVEAFAEPRDLAAEAQKLADSLGVAPRDLAGAVAMLFEAGFLTDKSARDEAEAAAKILGAARDAGERLDTLRREQRRGAADYWASTATRDIADLAAPRRAVEIILLGDCDLQQEAEFLRLAGAARGLDFRIGATFPNDPGYAAERPADILIIGALRSRAAVSQSSAAYIEDARRLIEDLRAATAAPILIDNLPKPTVQPLGLAERGAQGHRNRYRRVNLELAELVEAFSDVHVVDVAAALNQAGSAKLIDDGLMSFTHFGSPGWLLTRPETEKLALHGLAPDIKPLAETLDGDPHARERIVAEAHVDALISTLGIDAKKAIVVDLDGVLWPGVLAETGAPFAWSPELSGLASWFGLYLGVHEALKMLKRRGLVLAACSKNDEATLRALWRYPEHYPRDRLLTPEDFASLRVNWRPKSDNLREIADELGFATQTLIFIDDNPRERAEVSSALPEVEVWSEDIFTLRRRLLTDPRLQSPRVSAEAADRNALTKARIDREKLRLEARDEAAFHAGLNLSADIFPARDSAELRRVVELFQRATQFNVSGRRFTEGELAAKTVFVLKARDRFADHGLVAAAVVEHGEILNFAMSCRVIGLGLERRLIDAVVAHCGQARGRYIATDRNAPARHLYRDAGFTRGEDGYWRRATQAAA